MPSFAQHSSVDVGTDFVILRRSAGAYFDALPTLTNFISNQDIGIRTKTVGHNATAIKLKFAEDSMAIVGTQSCFP